MNIHDTAISNDAKGPSVFKGGARASFLRQLRKAACENDFPIDYTKEINGRRCINQATSEQKLWSLGLLTDSILYPYWQNRSHFDDALQDPIVLHKRLTCQAYAHAVPCSQYQIPTETLFAYEPYCCLECEAEPSMTELHRELSNIHVYIDTDAPEHAAKIVPELLSKRICKHRRSFLRDKYQAAGAHGDRQQ